VAVGSLSHFRCRDPRWRTRHRVKNTAGANAAGLLGGTATKPSALVQQRLAVTWRDGPAATPANKTIACAGKAPGAVEMAWPSRNGALRCFPGHQPRHRGRWWTNRGGERGGAFSSGLRVSRWDGYTRAGSGVPGTKQGRTNVHPRGRRTSAGAARGEDRGVEPGGMGGLDRRSRHRR